MTKLLLFNQQKSTEILYYVLFIFLTIVLSACGDGYYSSSETGSIAFSVEWRGAPQESSGRYTASLDCDSAGVATVAAEVYDESSLYLTSGGPWLCSAHTGTIENVPAGPDRTAVVLGKDINGDVLYRGEKSGITVTAGETTDAGAIVVEPFNPVLTPPVLISPTEEETVTSGAFSFEWHLTAGASQFQIQVSEDTNFTSTVIDETVTTTFYTLTTSLSAGTYYWRVKAKDSDGNESAWSEVWGFTVSAQSGVAPSTPTGVTLTAGDQENTIRWDTVSGATSYNIYWSTSQGVTKETGTKISTFSSPYTHTGLTNGTTYYYVVTAENDYGEGGESNEVSIAPSAIGTNTSPTATITSPSDGSTYTEEESITFSGSGDDAEDGPLTGSSLVWTSSIDGQIGTGTSFTRDDLSTGTHTIILSATDSDGAAGSDSLTITVNSINEGLVAHYPFNGNANDESGNGNDGTVDGATLTDDRFGNADTAYSFDGDDFIIVEDKFELRLNGDFTLSAWIYLTSYAPIHRDVIMTKRGIGSNDGWFLAIQGSNDPLNKGALMYNVSGGGDPVVFSNGAIVLNTWTHVAVSYQEATETLEMYLNGVLDIRATSIPAPNPDTDVDLHIGKDSGGGYGPYFFNGSIDDIFIYNRALSEDKIQNLYNP